MYRWISIIITSIRKQIQFQPNAPTLDPGVGPFKLLHQRQLLRIGTIQKGPRFDNRGDLVWRKIQKKSCLGSKNRHPCNELWHVDSIIPLISATIRWAHMSSPGHARWQNVVCYWVPPGSRVPSYLTLRAALKITMLRTFCIDKTVSWYKLVQILIYLHIFADRTH